jgi:hypothetical protein
MSPAAKPKRAQAQEQAMLEQSTRIALEQVIQGKLDEIIKAVKRG